MSPPRAGPASLALALALGGVSALVFVFALSRHIHVDEFHNVFSMQLVGSFGKSDYADPAELYHVLFAPLTRRFESTRSIFFALRIVWGALFIGLFAGLAWVQPFFPQLWGRALVFVAVASWWPAWRHGFEVRHDLLLALGVVWLYRVGLEAERHERLSAWSAALAGAAAAWMQLDSHKAVTLWGPALLYILALRVHVARPDARRSAGWLAVGLCCGVLSGFGLLWWGGALGAYFTQLAHFSHYAAGAERLSPLPLFVFMLETGSIQIAFVLLFLVGALLQKMRQRLAPHALTTLAFLSFSLLALAVNPVPFPYNMVWATPALLLAATAGAHWLLQQTPRLRLLLAGALVALCMAQFEHQIVSDDYMNRSWDAQLKLVEAVESLTGPSEPVFDGVGMVCTRPPATRDWLLHSVFMPEYETGRREQLRDVIARVAPPVLIGGHYRFDWLLDADRSAIAAHYLGLSRQLWVLGVQTVGVEAAVSILRAGRYQVLPLAPSDGSVQVDGQSVAARGVVSLTAGTHQVVGAAAIVWLGPALQDVPAGLALGGSLFAPRRLPGQ